MQVTAGTGMQINVLAGFAICNGCLKLLELNALLDISAASTVNDRIDTVVLRLDDNDDKRECELYVLTGTPATTPIAPALMRSGSVWELGLADILVKANSTQISNANITDTRYDTERCGIISSISEFDTTTLYKQVQTDLKEFQNVSQAEFEAWFANIRDQLEGDVAANLQSQIGTLSELKTEEKTDLVKAINEVAAKEVDVLDTKEEILANTEAGKVAGANGVKEIVTEINDSLGGVSQFIVDETTGKITGYKTEIGGADTVFPFSGTDGLYIIGTKYLRDRSFTTDPLSFNRTPTMCTSNGFQCMTEPIDLTPYNTIKFGAQAYTHSAKESGIGITKNIPTSIADCKSIKYAEKTISTLTTNTLIELELDISDIQGEYYISTYSTCSAGHSTLYLYLE